MERTASISTPAKFLAVFMAIIVALAFVPSPAYAASKTVKKQDFTTTTKVIQKKAATVKKGTTKLTIKGGVGWMKFKAPKTKKYSFKFSNLKTKGYSSNAFISAYVIDKYGLDSKTLKTKGGKSSTLWLSVNGAKFTTGKTLGRPIATRTGTVKLKKGETLYLYIYNGSEKTTATLKIK